MYSNGILSWGMGLSVVSASLCVITAGVKHARCDSGAGIATKVGAQ